VGEGRAHTPDASVPERSITEQDGSVGLRDAVQFDQGSLGHSIHIAAKQ
jgi:hypothetical protein